MHVECLQGRRIHALFREVRSHKRIQCVSGGQLFLGEPANDLVPIPAHAHIRDCCLQCDHNR